MSLFRLHEWYKLEAGEAHYITVTNVLGKGRDQIILGSLNGTLTVVDPMHDVENRHETAVLLQKQLPQPILAILVGRFIASYDATLLAVLHPRTLTFYRIGTINNESHTLDFIFEHQLRGAVAFNMCLGEFTRGQFSQLYVQSLDCTLSLYEGENHLLEWRLPSAIHPGPICYASASKSLYSGSGGRLSCFPTHSFTASGNSKNAKKVTPEWSFNLGDMAVDMASTEVKPIQPSIVVLCRRSLFCLTHGGTPRFVIRLQNIGTSLIVYKTTNDPKIQMIIGTAAQSLLFYRDTTMVWSVQADFVPIGVVLATFSDNLKGMICVLTNEAKLIAGFLGTRPSLFGLPTTENRYIDFDRRRAEMEAFEKRIEAAGGVVKNPKGGDEAEEEPEGMGGLLGPLKVQLMGVELDAPSRAFDTWDDIPSATVRIRVTSSAPGVTLAFESDAFAHSNYFRLQPAEYQELPITVFARGEPIRDGRFRIVATSADGDAELIDSHLPLPLICRAVEPQRHQQVKINVDCSATGADCRELFADFPVETPTAVGFQPFGGDSVVSVFSAKNGRYRVQAETAEFVFVVLEELVRRLRLKYPSAQLSTAVPLHLFVVGIAEFVDLETRRRAELADIERISVQMRDAETILINKLKAERKDLSMTPTNVLINYTYREMLTAIDRMRQTDEELERRRRTRLCPLLNLMRLVLEMADVRLPFDGRIIRGGREPLADRILPLLGGAQSSADISSEDITRLLIAFCESAHGAPLAGIAEVGEDEEEAAERTEQTEFVTLANSLATAAVAEAADEAAGSTLPDE